VTLTIHTEEDAQRQVALTIEVAEDRIEKAVQAKIRTLSRDVHIPGFRKGKVPAQVLVRRVGEEALRAEVIDEVLPDILQEALTEANLEPYGMPRVDDMTLKPLVVKLTVPLEPEVELHDYRAIRKEIPPIEISEEAVAAALERVREEHQVLEPVERPVELGDMVTATVQGWLLEADDKVPFINEERGDFLMDPAKTLPDTPFVENVIGMRNEENKTFQFTFADTFENDDLKGKEALFEVTMLDVRRRELPELDDELAQVDGAYETLDELREALRQQLQTAAEEQAKSDLMETVLEEIIAAADILYPPAAVERELDHKVSELRERVTKSGGKWQEYLASLNEQESDLRARWQEGAEKQLRQSLVLRELIIQEKISVEPGDVEVALNSRLGHFQDPTVQEYMRKLLTEGQGMNMLASEIIMGKVQQRIEAIVSGNAPDLEALERALIDERTLLTEEEE
jgi:trigger factor